MSECFNIRMRFMSAVYIHYPFCTRKCFYCDFYSVNAPTTQSDYIDILCREIEMRCSGLGRPLLSSLFVGGGTPSLMSGKDMEKIMNALHSNFTFDEEAELSMESNPASLDLQNLIDYRSAGINRLSIGIQSFIADELIFLQRLHSPNEAEAAFEAARKAGFDNINIDLMFSVPGQTRDTLKYSLEKAIRIAPEHISAYSLIYEQGTPLYKAAEAGTISRVDDDNDAENYELVIDTLTDAGYRQYEVSNFAQPGKECRHNLKYWSGDEYFAFGPAAHGYLNNTRYANIRNLTEYTKMISNTKFPTDSSEILTTENKLAEAIFLGLRSGGLTWQKFREQFDIDIKSVSSKIFNELIKGNYA
ncbi:MAG: radical SAM family heme chaperone HemW, partial [Candidatus Kapabacteria bacterium]|nr:radical SAM family heme chaperone HemW [Candidatus Kapabacteria bacterium]